MDNKIFIGLAMFILLILSIVGIAFGVSVLVNNFGTVGFIAAPFLALLVAYGVYLLQKKLYKRFINPVQ